jgi:hypothetical protein
MLRADAAATTGTVLKRLLLLRGAKPVSTNRQKKKWIEWQRQKCRGRDEYRDAIRYAGDATSSREQRPGNDGDRDRRRRSGKADIII